jgi:hypothetical protein
MMENNNRSTKNNQLESWMTRKEGSERDGIYS